MLKRGLWATGFFLFLSAHAWVLEPPTSEQLARYRKEGRLQERIAAARAIGNHHVAPRIAQRARARLLQLAGVDRVANTSRMAPPPAWQGLPTTGTVKILAVLIAFWDYPYANPGWIVDAALFGTGDAAMFPYESLHNYYQRSSYNQLDIQGNTLEWYTMLYPRSAVPQDTAGRENLIKEVLDYNDAIGHDFSQYDNDGDGVIDYFIVLWTGPTGDWASFWWGKMTHFQDSSYMLDGKRLDGYSWQSETYSDSTNVRVRTVIHETGHALGLPDYYDYDDSVGPRGGVGGLDIMDGYGDHNCFSKFLLDWITPVTRSGGTATVSLNASHSSPDATLFMKGAVAGDGFDEFFMVQNRQGGQNDSGYPTDGLLIWHVDSRLNAGGTNFLYDNSYTEHKLLRLMEADGLEQIEQDLPADAGDYYTIGESFGPTTTPDSSKYDYLASWMGVRNIPVAGSPMTFEIFEEAPDTTPPVGSPSTPTDEGSVTNNEVVRFDWTAGTAADPESGITSYSFQVGTAPGGSDVFDQLVGKALTWFVTGCQDGDTCYARVRGMNGAGLFSSWSAVSDGIFVSLPLTMPSNLRVTRTTATSASIAWDDASGETGYRVYRRSGSDFVLHADLGANTTTYTDAGLACGSQNFYTVSAYNVTSGESAQTDSVQADTLPCGVVFQDFMESGVNGWTGSWAQTTSSSYSPTHSWTDSPGGDYANNTNSGLFSPVIDLVGVASARLSFRHRFDFAAGDVGNVWIKRMSTNEYIELGDFVGTAPSWRQDEFSLYTFLGQSIQVIFQVYSDAAATADGWYIDDVLVNIPSISGSVSVEGVGTPVSGVIVRVYDSGNDYVGSGITDSFGDYAVTGLAAGTYYACTHNVSGYVDELYDGIACPGGGCSLFNHGTPITVSTGIPTMGIDFALSPGGIITGTVTDSVTGVALTGGRVAYYDTNGSLVGSNNVDSKGAYASWGLPAGAYYARAYLFSGYFQELYDGVRCYESCDPTSGTPITVTAPGTTPGVDFALTKGGSISGTVTADGTGTPLDGIRVSALDASINSSGSAVTNSSGIYTIDTLASGSYYVRTNGSPGYVGELYDDVLCPNGVCPTYPGIGMQVPVTEGLTASGINFALGQSGTISGKVTEEGSGTPLAASLWLRNEAGVTVQWLNCDGSGSYSAAGLAPGNYRLAVSMFDNDHVPELFDDIPWLTWPWGLAGAPITVTAGETSTANIELVVGGRVRGRVTDEATRLGIVDVTVSIYNGMEWQGATTDVNGDYEITGLPSGEYLVFTANKSGYIDEYYDDITVTGGRTPPNMGTVPVTVTAGVTTPDIDFALARAGRIEGTVTNEGTLAPIESVRVNIYNETGFRVTTGRTNALGHYVSESGLAAGTYYARTDNDSGYVNECYGDIVCAIIETPGPQTTSNPHFVAGTPIDVPSGVTVSGVDFTLHEGGRIEGTILDVYGRPIGGVASVFDDENNIVANISVEGDGNYVTSQGLPTGSYYVMANGGTRCVSEVFDDVTCLGCDPNTGTPVTVTEGATTSGVDFHLALGGGIAGRVYDEVSGRGFPSFVEVWNASGAYLKHATVYGDFAGGYATSGLPSGSYYVKTRNWVGYMNEAYDDVPCGHECDLSGATLVSVTAGTVSWDVDFPLTRGATISGAVTNDLGRSLGGVDGAIYDASGKLVESWSSDVQGRHASLGSLPDGVYYSRTKNNAGYCDEVWDDVACVGACDVTIGAPIVISGGSDVSEVDFELAECVPIRKPRGLRIKNR